MFRWKKYKSKRGFTLLECVVSLFVIGLIMQALLLAVQSYRQIDEAIRTDYTARWYQFLAVLEQEMADYRLVAVENDRFVIRDRTGQNFMMLHKNHKIYKIRGYQPFLYEVRGWQIGYDAPFLAIVVEFDNGQVFSGSIYLEVADEES